MNTSQFLFDIYIFLITLFKGFGAEGGSKLYVAAFAVGCVAVAAKILREYYTRRELIVLGIILLIGVADFLIGHETTILFSAVAMCGLKGVETRRLIKISLWTRVAAFACLVGGSVLGLIENRAIGSSRGGVPVYRYYLGYSHPNIAQASFTIIIMLALYLYGKKMNLWHYLALTLLSCVLYRYTYSRTGLLVALICILLNWVCRNDKIMKVLAHAFKYSYFLFFFLTLAMALAFGHLPIMTKIDALLSYRIAYNSALIRQCIPPLIGSTRYNDLVNIDNGYIALLYEGGILAFAWFSYFIVKEYSRCLKNRRFEKCILMFEFILYAMTESFYPSVAVNVSLLFIGSSIFENKAWIQKHE